MKEVYIVVRVFVSNKYFSFAKTFNFLHKTRDDLVQYVPSLKCWIFENLLVTVA